MPDITQQNTYDEQVKAWHAFKAEQAAAAAARRKPLAIALRTLKTVADLPQGVLADIKQTVMSYPIAVPSIILSALPREGLGKLVSPLTEKVDNWQLGRLNRAIAEVASVPEGKLLVDQAKKDGVPIVGAGGIGMGGVTFTRNEINKETGQRELKALIRVNLFQSHGNLVRVLAHELEHYNQAKNGLGTQTKGIQAPLDRMWDNRMVEADAEATATDIAYKLKQAGKPAAWNAVTRLNPGYAAVGNAYAEEVRKDPSSALDGRAKRAAFDGWFKARNKMVGTDISKVYNGQGVSSIRSVATLKLAAQTPGAQISPLTAAEIKKLGTILPAKNNYLDLPNQKPLDSAYYRAPNFNKQDMQRIQMGYDDYAVLKTNSAFMTSPVSTAPATPAARPASFSPPPVSMKHMPMAQQMAKSAPVSLARVPKIKI